MRLSSNQIEAIKQEAECCSGARAWLFGSHAGAQQRGFSLVELIMTMIIVGILAAVAAPRFFDANVFQSRGFADQVQATLRYAQKVAIAQRRNVCATFTLGPPSTITLRIASLSGAASACDTNLTTLEGVTPYVLTAPAGITFTALPVAFSFDALGHPTPGALPQINIIGAANGITIEAETGYVHSP
ncbi:MAG TPA: prepilin-type N-terminal cleavage/methylation domain-containing protein [Gallionella sp.]|nr:prepilin-type N-terminal cleavage/methylation domain-containing protein [Gallionella sp.]